MRAMGKFTLGFLLASVLLCPASPFRINKKKRKHRVHTSSVKSEAPPQRIEDWWPELAQFFREDGQQVGSGNEGVVAVFTCTQFKPQFQLAFKKLIGDDCFFTGNFEDLRKVPDFYYGKVLDHAYVIKCYGIYASVELDLYNPVVMMEAAYLSMDKIIRLAEINWMQSPVKSKVLARWILQMLVAVEYIHGLGFVHADLKPEQFMIDTEFPSVEVSELGTRLEQNQFLQLSKKSNIKLGDLGFMCSAEGELGACSKPLAGTRPYLDPMTLKHEFNSKQTDMWAMGVTIYWMAYGGQFPDFIKKPDREYKHEMALLQNKQHQMTDGEFLRKKDMITKDFLQKVQQGYDSLPKPWPPLSGIHQVIAGCFSRSTASAVVEIAAQNAEDLLWLPKAEITKIRNTKEWFDNEFRETMPPLMFSQVENQNKGKVPQWEQLPVEVESKELRKQRTSKMDNIIGFFKRSEGNAEAWKNGFRIDPKGKRIPSGQHRSYTIDFQDRVPKIQVKKRGKPKASEGTLELENDGDWNGCMTAQVQYKTKGPWKGMTCCTATEAIELTIRVCLTNDENTISVKEEVEPGRTYSKSVGLITEETYFTRDPPRK